MIQRPLARFSGGLSSQQLLMLRGRSAPEALSYRWSSRPQMRSYPFHGVSRSRPFSAAVIADNAVQGTVELITQLHITTGTPWFLTIPLVALTVNICFRLPFAIYTRIIQQRQGRLNHVLQAWLIRHQLQQAARQPGEKTSKEVARQYKSTENRIFREFGVQNWKSYSQILVFPFWLTTIEALRRMSGGRRGLLGSLFFGAGDETNAAAARGGHDAVAASSGFTADSHAASADVMGLTPGDLLSSNAPLQLYAAADPTLAAGGCLWFPDLLVPDPLHILPLLLSTVLVWNVMPRTAEGRRLLLGLSGENIPATTTLSRLRLQRALVAVSAIIGPLTMDLPCALHLYWLSSSVSTLVMTRIVHWLLPSKRAMIRPCQGNESVIIQAQYPGT